MHINGDNRPVDVTARRRADAAARTREVGQADTKAAASNDAAGGTLADSFDPAAVSRFVAILKNMNPVDLHRVEELRARIADGSYNADSEDLADLLSSSDETPPNRSA